MSQIVPITTPRRALNNVWAGRLNIMAVENSIRAADKASVTKKILKPATLFWRKILTTCGSWFTAKIRSIIQPAYQPIFKYACVHRGINKRELNVFAPYKKQYGFMTFTSS